MSLQAGLDEYRKSFSGLLHEDDIPARAVQFFHAHDLCHVVFGCDTSIPHEVMADTWSMFGTSVRFREYLDYLKLPQAKNVFQDIGYGRTAWESMRALPRLVKVVLQVRRMKQPRPFWDNGQYLDGSLRGIRTEFNIRLV